MRKWAFLGNMGEPAAPEEARNRDAVRLFGSSDREEALGVVVLEILLCYPTARNRVGLDSFLNDNLGLFPGTGTLLMGLEGAGMLDGFVPTARGRDTIRSLHAGWAQHQLRNESRAIGRFDTWSEKVLELRRRHLR